MNIALGSVQLEGSAGLVCVLRDRVRGQEDSGPHLERLGAGCFRHGGRVGQSASQPASQPTSQAAIQPASQARVQERLVVWAIRLA